MFDAELPMAVARAFGTTRATALSIPLPAQPVPNAAMVPGTKAGCCSQAARANGSVAISRDTACTTRSTTRRHR